MVEAPAENEAELQQVCVAHPELLPCDTLGFSPLLVIGQQVSLPPGLAELLALDRTGRVVALEFKLNANLHLRRAVGQLLEYAAALWGRSYADLERIALGFFSSGHCPEPRLRAARTLEEGARLFWSQGESSHGAFRPELFRANVEANLAAGSLELVLVADQIPPSLEQTAAYLRSVGRVRLHGVELVRFERGGTVAYVPQVVFGGQACSRPQLVPPGEEPTMEEAQPPPPAAATPGGEGELRSGVWGLIQADRPEGDGR